MSALPFLTLDDVPLAGQTVFARLDLNCPVDEKTKQPQLSPRITAHARTVLELSLAGARVVLLAHQGRKGDEDFTSLEIHAGLLQSEVNDLARMTQKKAPAIRFVDDVCGEKAKQAISSLKDGEVVLLQNVRYLDDETKFDKNGGKSELVKSLGSLCDIFVLDAFSCSHRAHASVVGFCKVPVLAGSVMAQELGALSQFDHPARPVIFVMGGAKPDDSLPILSAWLSSGKLDYALTGGSMANLMLLASGRDIGEPSKQFLANKGALDSLPAARDLLAKYPDKILVPDDVIVDDHGTPRILAARTLPSPFPILDIGPVTSARYGGLLREAGSIVMNGPMGVYEKEAFASGTRTVLEAISQSTGFSLLGGGHTISAIGKFGIDRTCLGYVSLSGKALIEYLCGEKLPGVVLLEQSAVKWREQKAQEDAEGTGSPITPSTSKSKTRVKPGKTAKTPARRSKQVRASSSKSVSSRTSRARPSKTSRKPISPRKSKRR